jgi:hypothetical protein
MKQAFLLAIALAGCPTVALSQGTFDYTYVEAFYQGDDTSDADGPGVIGSLALGDRWFVFGEYSRDTDGYGDGSTYGRQVENAEYYDLESDYKRIGLGFHHPLGARLDFVSRVMRDRRDSTVRFQYWDPRGHPFNSGTVSYSYDTRVDITQAEAGVRGLLASRWEAWGMVGYSYTSRPEASNIEVIDLTNPVCGQEFPNNCKLTPPALRAAIESREGVGNAYARLGTHVRLTDHWGLSAEGRFSPGGRVSYFAGIRYTF